MTAPKLPDDVREKAVAAVKPILRRRASFDPQFTKDADAIIDAFLLALSESGRVVVPREPSEAMKNAGFGCLIADQNSKIHLVQAYRAMISAEGEGK